MCQLHDEMCLEILLNFCSGILCMFVSVMYHSEVVLVIVTILTTLATYDNIHERTRINTALKYLYGQA